MNFGYCTNQKVRRAMETYNLLQIGYTKDMDKEDAEILDIIQEIHTEVLKKQEREVNKKW